MYIKRIPCKLGISTFALQSILMIAKRTLSHNQVRRCRTLCYHAAHPSVMGVLNRTAHTPEVVCVFPRVSPRLDLWIEVHPHQPPAAPGAPKVRFPCPEAPATILPRKALVLCKQARRVSKDWERLGDRRN